MLLEIGTILAQAGRSGLLRSAFWMWLGFAAIGLIVVMVVWVILAGWSRPSLGAGLGTRTPRRGPRIKDAWAEAGRRAAPADEEDFREPDDEDQRDQDEDQNEDLR